MSVIIGTNSTEIIPDSNMDDFIFGRAGDDTFLCYFGNDLIFGGAGDDTFILAPQTDSVVYLNGGRGCDTLVLARDPVSIEHIGNKMIVEYDYDMVIITNKIEDVVF